MSNTSAEFQRDGASPVPRSIRRAFRPPDDGRGLDPVTRGYRELVEVDDIVMFADRFDQRVALIVSTASEEELRRVLDDCARRSAACVCIADFVSVAPHDPLFHMLFTVSGKPRRDLIWRLLVGCTESLTLDGDRMTATGRQLSQRPACSRMSHDHALCARAG
jgi:hypothetical protein